ncbi:hypothetical protein [Actinacidiphila sp. bgisy160]|uniref:hypothetical protein n=1 Tax=Actinacidiphila sp. bgisy160 TaxID=3413796 RepID=UPI003D725338
MHDRSCAGSTAPHPARRTAFVRDTTSPDRARIAVDHAPAPVRSGAWDQHLAPLGGAR